MTKNKILFIIACFVAIFVGIVLYSWHIETMVADGQQTVLLAPKKLSSESKSVLRLWVKDHSQNKPIEKAQVSAKLVSSKEKISLGETITDGKGNAQIEFVVPKIVDGNYKLEVTTVSDIGRDVQELNVAIKKDYKILLSTDKPLYQPGQVIHLRTLMMDCFNNGPVAKENILIEIQDPKGNKVFKKELTSSEFGIAACDFQLASEINEGAYILKATCGKFSEQKNLNVKRYVLPKFKVEANFSKSYYMPGENVQGKIDSRYFFGKPVANANVVVDVSTFDVNFNKLLSWKGKTSDDGKCAIEFSLPQKLYGSALTKGSAMVTANITVTDTANHSQKITKNITVSKDTLNIFAIPEGRHIVKGVTNTIFLCTTYPNGLPAATEITVNGEMVVTNELGIGVWKTVPQDAPFSIQVAGQDSQGNRIEKRIRVGNKQGTFLGVLNRATYKAGEQVTLDVLSSGYRGNFYVDIVKEGQAIASHIVTAVESKHRLQFTLPQGITGTLAINIYKSSEANLIERDTRLLFVSPAQDLEITTKLDKDVYRPGEKATIDFSTNSAQAALSLSIVDESVFALQEMQPGLEKVYFMLHSELLKPRYQIRYAPPVSAAEIVSIAPKNKTHENKDQAARVMFAIASGVETYTQHNDSYQPKLQKIQESKDLYFKKLRTFFVSIPFAANGLICLFAIIIIFYKVIAKKSLYYKETTPAQKTFAFIYLHYKVFLTSLIFFALSMFAMEVVRGKLPALIVFTICCAIFVGLFSLSKKDHGRLHRGWLVCAIITTTMMMIEFGFSGSNRWRYVREIQEAIAILCSIVLGKSLLLTLGYMVRYFLHKERLRQSHLVLGLLTSFLVCCALSVLSLFIVEENYSLRYYIGRDNIELAFITSGFVVLFLAPLFSTYLRSFLHEVSVKTLFKSISPSALLLAVMFTLPTLSSVGEKNIRLLEVAKQNVFFENTREDRGGVLAMKKSQNSPQTGKRQVRIRKHFPETLYWNPQLLTNDGKAQIKIPVSDSITTFRMVCQGVDKNGNLGSTTTGIRVFQDFFVDIDFPVALTQNDIVTVPIQIYNYLKTEQQIKLVMEKEPWFECLDEVEKQLTIPANNVSVAYFRIRAKKVGAKQLTVFAYGSKMDDAVRRSVTIEPDGKKMETVINGSLDQTTTHQCTIPENSIDEASKIIVKCYPGITSILVEGLEGMLRLPGG
ncbi:MG2 domain-containing protein [Candidatus Uabimicrobium sp. HlEnr_7]|uniref:MG2 domain-containing protein n=1 Tax=Candidatus Uabimicrobium helgolandensis TaxID=3095367 RepID=UPI003557C223